MYFNFVQFRSMVPRRAPAPSVQFPRVYSVFAHFGPQLDPTTNKPLFNDAAWAKAKNVLQEILQGYCADPPNHEFSILRVDDNSQPMKNRLGCNEYDYCRGTNHTETSHKQIRARGRWECEPEMRFQPSIATATITNCRSAGDLGSRSWGTLTFGKSILCRNWFCTTTTSYYTPGGAVLVTSRRLLRNWVWFHCNLRGLPTLSMR